LPDEAPQKPAVWIHTVGFVGLSARVTIFAVRALQMVAATTEARVAPIELFFDLVFVFGLTQITTLMA
jgi:hypothetical protein